MMANTDVDLELLSKLTHVFRLTRICQVASKPRAKVVWRVVIYLDILSMT